MRTEEPARKPRGRREFLAAAGAASATLLLAARAPRRAPQAGAEDDGDELVRMQRDLERALEGDPTRIGWAMAVDTRKCIGCRACVVACISENALPQGVAYRTVPDVEVGSYPEVRQIFMPGNCFQCDNPPCRDAAPEGAITKRADGIVEFHYDLLRGAEVAEAVARACPYGAVSVDQGRRWTEGTPAPQPYESREVPEYGKVPSLLEHEGAEPVARKCTFCAHRLAAGRLPACVTTCVGRAMYFGDRNDPGSLISEKLSGNPTFVLNEKLGTQPRLVHITDDPATCQACHS